MWRCEDSRLAHRPREKLLVIAQLAEHSTVVVRLPSSIERSLVRFRLTRGPMCATRTHRRTRISNPEVVSSILTRGNALQRACLDSSVGQSVGLIRLREPRLPIEGTRAHRPPKRWRGPRPRLQCRPLSFFERVDRLPVQPFLISVLVLATVSLSAVAKSITAQI